MDASASTGVDNTRYEVCSLYLNVDNIVLPTALNRSKKIKYTKLPDFDFDTRASWSRQSYTLPPRLRRIIALDEQEFDVATSRSLQYEPKAPQRPTFAISKRKIITITEDDENEIYPVYSKNKMSVRKETQSNRALTAALGPVKTTSCIPSPKHSRSSRNVKSASLSSTKNLSTLRGTQKLIHTSDSVRSLPKCNSKIYNLKEKDATYSPSILKSVSKVSDKKSGIKAIIDSKEKNSKSLSTDSKEKNSRSIITDSKEKNSRSISDSKEKFTARSMRNKLTEPPKVGKTALKPPVHTSMPPKPPARPETTLLKKIKATNRINDVVKEIHVPVMDKCESKNVIKTMMTKIIVQPVENKSVMKFQVDKFTEVDEKVNVDIKVGTDSPPEVVNVDIKVGTDSPPELVDNSTEMERLHLTPKFVNDEQVTVVNHFDSLDIPNVTLLKDRSDMPKEETVRNNSHSLTNLNVPASNLQLSKSAVHVSPEKARGMQITNNTSYIISRATLTYTTKQKINFHVLGNKSHSATDLYSSPLSYPMNVVSVYKKEVKKRDLNDAIEADKNTQSEKNELRIENINPWKEIKSLNCSNFLDTGKLVKPSDVITTIRVNGDLLQNDYICEQFQRELNFIDSFFESLQYLESCSLSNKCFDDDRVENWVSKSGFDVTNPKYDSLFSKFESDAENEDTETIASKSLCLLNLLIRDERRRAKNLLFVLKMREDALKDFTKSQILWLENKKKQDNTDISTLKKKQRGALLKLQHECGEMQRMRKALLALSEKRKVALMKTKKNIELKLNNNVNVDQIVLGKKKIKRNTPDRNVAPLKCFDLSSSGCDESILHQLTRPKSDSALVVTQSVVSSAEKSIQTGHSVLEPSPLSPPPPQLPPPPPPRERARIVDRATSTAAEHYVVVDGGYLNILFQNMTLPQIFSAGKQYEVNEEALKTIVNSTNSRHSCLNDTDILGKFMDQIKSRDLDKSSSPSTARSLVEELDQYYTGLVEDENSQTDFGESELKIRDHSADRTYNVDNKQSKSSQEILQTSFVGSSCTVAGPQDSISLTDKASEAMGVILDSCTPADNHITDFERQSIKSHDADSVGVAVEAGPLPVPAGSAAATDTTPQDVPVCLIKQSSNSSLGADSSMSSASPCPSVSSVTYSPPSISEAEELRRQQLAIEREIKALEQQQQILVVREIPDKPPPPYTPPTEPRSQKSLRMFAYDEAVEQKIESYMSHPVRGADDSGDPIDVYINDYCVEKIDKYKYEDSDKPWVACNLLPQKPPLDVGKLVERAKTEMAEILAGVHPTAVTGVGMAVGARRADHIDDILFAEWRRFEPEWTALHTDEASVKNQIFESIFQKILSESVDEYKKNVLNKKISVSDGQSG